MVPGPGVSNLIGAGNMDGFVSKLAQTPAIGFADRDTLTWRQVFGESTYNVYRSDGGLPGTFRCRSADQHVESLVDPDLPMVGNLFAYLVTTVNSVGEEGIMGFQVLNGVPVALRPNQDPCGSTVP
jgi:hypothetical protein